MNNAKELNQTNDFAGVTGGVVIQRQARGKSGVNSYFERQELAITQCHWQVIWFQIISRVCRWDLKLASAKSNSLLLQIIQIEPTSQHGRFSAWVVVEGVMRKIPITVPRVFYLNSKAPVTEDFPGRRVNKILPHGHHSYNLIEVHPLSVHLKPKGICCHTAEQLRQIFNEFFVFFCMWLLGHN